MTEWNASEYHRRSGLQQWLAETSLAQLDFGGDERVLDVGCGDGRITAEIAARLPRGVAVGVDASHHMVDFARAQAAAANLAFEVADATALPYQGQFDLVVSFNALHWVARQAEALAGIRRALRPGGRARLQMVPRGPRRSLEAVIDETRAAPAWASCFAGFRTPYAHFTPDEYRALALDAGFEVGGIAVAPRVWDFGTRAAFVDFARVTFVEWTQHVRADRRDAFIADVLDRYARLPHVGDDHTFHFDQMVVELGGGGRAGASPRR